MELLNILLTWEQEKESYVGEDRNKFCDSALLGQWTFKKSLVREVMQSENGKATGHERWYYVFQQIKFEEQFSELFICQYMNWTEHAQ